jgi:Signal transduction histidine kinase
MKITKFNTLRFQIKLVSALLLFVLIVLLGISIKRAFDANKQAEEYVIKNKISELLNAVAGWQAIERGYGTTIIGSGKGDASPFFPKFLEVTEKENSDVLQIEKEIEKLLNVRSNNAFEKILSKWRKGYESLVSARHKISSNDISKDEWLGIATLNIRNEFNLRNTAFTPQKTDEKILYLNTVLRPNIAILCEYAGLERALISNAIESGKPLSHETTNNIKSYRSIVDESLEQILILKELPTTSIRMKQAIEMIEKEFLQTYQFLKEEVFSSTERLEREINGVKENITKRNIICQNYLSGINTELINISKNENVVALAKTLSLQAENDINISEQLSAVENLFNTFSQVKRVYDQIRFLDNFGYERVRVDFDGNVTNIIRDTKLQDKSEKYYFKKSVNLPQGSIYTSPLDLNMEHGRIETPYKPVIRFSTPVFADGKQAGIIVFNLLTNTPSFLHKVIGDEDGKDYILADQDGFYLHHPDKVKEWGMMELLNKSHHNIRQDYPDVAEQVLSGREGSVSLVSGSVIVYKPFFFNPDTDNFWVIIKRVKGVNYPVSASAWFDEATKAINTGLAISTIAGEEADVIMLEMESTSKRNMLISYTLLGFAVFVFAYFSRWSKNRVLKPIQILTGATKKIAQGDFSHRADVNQGDEIGVMANNFNIMADELTNDITMRKQAERRLNAQYYVTKVLAESTTIKEASSKILQAICMVLEWDLGEIWEFDQQDRVLRCSEIWHVLSIKVSEFKKITRQTPLAKGIGLPGRVFESAQPAWIADVVEDKNFPRASIAAKDGLHGAFGFPILSGDDVLGTISFYSCEIRLPDKDLVNMLLSIGRQIGLFIKQEQTDNEMKKIEEALVQADKLKSLGTITAGVAHEFNNILAIISGNVQLLERTYKDHDELMDAFRTIRAASDDGAEISSKMLQFTKTNPSAKEFVSFDTRDLIKQSIDFTMPRWKNMAQAKGANYHIDKEGMKKVRSIMCNPTELREVFINIINNALDAMSKGGSLSFGTWDKNDTIFIRISDTGKGMPDSVRKKIFDPFYTTRRPLGTGLGMSIVHSIIKRHGGKIEVGSEVGKGTTVTISIPVTKEKAQQKVLSGQETQEIKAKGLRILVVDDDLKICNLLSSFLSKEGHQVKAVDISTEAIKLLEVEEFDLVLSDYAMPYATGYDIAMFLDRLERRPKIGIITGWDESVDVKKIEGIKIDFVIKKPFELLELARQINDVFTAE